LELILFTELVAVHSGIGLSGKDICNAAEPAVSNSCCVEDVA